MEQRKIKMSVEQAKELYGMKPELRKTLLHQFTDEELGINKAVTWESLGIIEGYFIGNSSQMHKIREREIGEYDKNIDTTKSDCLSYLAACQLRQIAKHYNDGEAEDEWVDWNQFHQDKNTAYFDYSMNDFKTIESVYSSFGLVLFKRKKDLEKCIEENRALWLQFLKVKES